MLYTVIILTVIICIFTYVLTKSDNKPSKFKFYFKFGVYYFITSAISAGIWPIFLLRPKNVKNAKIIVRLVKHVTKLFDLKWHLRNGKVIAEDRGAVIISNHQSSLDILGMFNIWDVVDKLAVVAKKEIFYVWPFGLAAYLAGVVFIDRRNARGAYKQLQITSEVMIKNKTKLWLFPEGTRNKDYTKLLPFKKGAFSIAVTAQVPIIPVVYSPYYFINRKKYIFANGGHIIIQCLDPVPTVGLTMDDVPDLMERVHERMSKAYKEISKEVFHSLPAPVVEQLGA